MTIFNEICANEQTFGRFRLLKEHSWKTRHDQIILKERSWTASKTVVWTCWPAFKTVQSFQKLLNHFKTVEPVDQRSKRKFQVWIIALNILTTQSPRGGSWEKVKKKIWKNQKINSERRKIHPLLHKSWRNRLHPPEIRMWCGWWWAKCWWYFCLHLYWYLICIQICIFVFVF